MSSPGRPSQHHPQNNTAARAGFDTASLLGSLRHGPSMNPNPPPLSSASHAQQHAPPTEPSPFSFATSSSALGNYIAAHQQHQPVASEPHPPLQHVAQPPQLLQVHLQHQLADLLRNTTQEQLLEALLRVQQQQPPAQQQQSPYVNAAAHPMHTAQQHQAHQQQQSPYVNAAAHPTHTAQQQLQHVLVQQPQLQAAHQPHQQQQYVLVPFSAFQQQQQQQQQQQRVIVAGPHHPEHLPQPQQLQPPNGQRQQHRGPSQQQQQQQQSHVRLPNGPGPLASFSQTDQVVVHLPMPLQQQQHHQRVLVAGPQQEQQQQRRGSEPLPTVMLQPFQPVAGLPMQHQHHAAAAGDNNILPSPMMQAAAGPSTATATPQHAKIVVPPPAPGDTEPGPRQLIVNYCPVDTTDAELCSLFGQIGPVEAARMIYDKVTGLTKGFGFVYFVKSADAEAAVERFAGFPLRGKRLKVSYAIPQRPVSSLGGAGATSLPSPTMSSNGSAPNSSASPTVGLTTLLLHPHSVRTDAVVLQHHHHHHFAPLNSSNPYVQSLTASTVPPQQFKPTPIDEAAASAAGVGALRTDSAARQQLQQVLHGYTFACSSQRRSSEPPSDTEDEFLGALLSGGGLPHEIDAAQQQRAAAQLAASTGSAPADPLSGPVRRDSCSTVAMGGLSPEPATPPRGSPRPKFSIASPQAQLSGAGSPTAPAPLPAGAGASKMPPPPLYLDFGMDTAAS